MSKFYIKDLTVQGRHGVTEQERSQSQRFRITAECSVDTTVAGRSDELKDTADWSKLRKIIIDTVEQTSFHLMERLAQEIANRFLEDPKIESVTISIEKFDAFDNGVPGIQIEVTR